MALSVPRIHRTLDSHKPLCGWDHRIWGMMAILSLISLRCGTVSRVEAVDRGPAPIRIKNRLTVQIETDPTPVMPFSHGHRATPRTLDFLVSH